MKATFPVVFLCLSGWLGSSLTQGQILVGFDSTPALGTSYSGSVDNSGTSGTAAVGAISSPVPFAIADPGAVWNKAIDLDISAGGLVPGATITLTENLFWNGSGPSPFTDWHETILNTDFNWVSGVISLGATGSISGGGKDIEFNFPPQTTPVTFSISKTLVYNGTLFTSSPTPVTLNIQERPSIPEPGDAMLLGGALLIFWAAGRQWRPRPA